MTQHDALLNIFMLSWEFPPRIIGGISAHVHDLSRALARKRVNVHVITCDFPGAPEYEEIGGVHVYRFNSYRIPAHTFLAWIFSMNQNMIERSIEVVDAHNGQIDVIHAHDWLVANAAIELKNRYEKPLLSTIHSTEIGRRGGIQSNHQRTINEIERRFVHESSRVICCSDYMANQVCRSFGLPREKVRVIPNGVEASRFNLKVDYHAVRQRFIEPNGKIVLYVGRLVHEKGVHVLIGALPKVLRVLPNVKLVIVGEGGMKESLLKEALHFGIQDKVFFTGFVDEKTLISLYKVSDVAVFPSLYEPFGITALEAMAAKVPVVVSDVGGLSEIVEHDETGVKVHPDNSDAVGWGIIRVLKDKIYANNIRKNAYRRIVEDYNWGKISDETIEVYQQLVATIPPKPAVMPKIKLPLSKVEMYPPEFQLLLSLYTLSAVRKEHAKTAGELSKMLDIEIIEIRRLLKKLVNSGFVATYKDGRRRLRYYLTDLGIIRACSLFS